MIADICNLETNKIMSGSLRYRVLRITNSARDFPNLKMRDMLGFALFVTTAVLALPAQDGSHLEPRFFRGQTRPQSSHSSQTSLPGNQGRHRQPEHAPHTAGNQNHGLSSYSSNSQYAVGNQANVAHSEANQILQYKATKAQAYNAKKLKRLQNTVNYRQAIARDNMRKAENKAHLQKVAADDVMRNAQEKAHRKNIVAGSKQSEMQYKEEFQTIAASETIRIAQDKANFERLSAENKQGETRVKANAEILRIENTQRDFQMQAAQKLAIEGKAQRNQEILENRNQIAEQQNERKERFEAENLYSVAAAEQSKMQNENYPNSQRFAERVPNEPRQRSFLGPWYSNRAPQSTSANRNGFQRTGVDTSSYMHQGARQNAQGPFLQPSGNPDDFPSGQQYPLNAGKMCLNGDASYSHSSNHGYSGVQHQEGVWPNQ